MNLQNIQQLQGAPQSVHVVPGFIGRTWRMAAEAMHGIEHPLVVSTFFAVGTLLVFTGTFWATVTTWDAIWMLQCGSIFLFSALLVVATTKKWRGAVWLGWSMIALSFGWGMWSGAWLLHPLGALISLVGFGYILYILYRETMPARAAYSAKLLP